MLDKVLVTKNTFINKIKNVENKLNENIQNEN